MKEGEKEYWMLLRESGSVQTQDQFLVINAILDRGKRLIARTP